MLVKENRLTKKKDFEEVFKHGKGIKQGFLYLKYKKNNLKSCRFGIIVGKNYSKKAVDRNKIKRRIREILAKKDVQGLDIIVVVLPGVESDFEKIKENVEKLFKKIN
jgi:ribonuclease P protein component